MKAGRKEQTTKQDQKAALSWRCVGDYKNKESQSVLVISLMNLSRFSLIKLRKMPRF